MRLISPIVVLTLYAVIAVGGCRQEQQTHQATGRIVLSDGSPLVGATISLEARGGTVSATAITDDQGEFNLGAFRIGGGLPAGVYRAVVTPPMDPDAKTPPPPCFHPKYRRYETSGLEFTVQEGGNRWEIKLDPP